jgi:hypothetical protein
MKKGILIDTKKRTISYVDVTPNKKGSYLPSIYEHIGCTRFEVVELPNQNDLFCDEESMLSMDENTMFFKIDGMMSVPIAGNGLILGLNEDGDSIDTNITLMDIVPNVQFYTAYEMAFRTRFGLLI